VYFLNRPRKFECYIRRNNLSQRIVIYSFRGVDNFADAVVIYIQVLALNVQNILLWLGTKARVAFLKTKSVRQPGVVIKVILFKLVKFIIEFLELS